MKKFTVPCDFGGKKAPFEVYIGNPKPGNHPLANQAGWLSRERGGSIPPEVMDSFQKLLDLANKNGVSFEELCVYALETAQEEEGEKGVENPGIEDKAAQSPDSPAPEPEKTTE